jgi:hypothetical protein
MTEDEARALPWPDKVTPHKTGNAWRWDGWCGPHAISDLCCAVANGYLPRAVLDHAIAASRGEEWLPGAWRQAIEETRQERSEVRAQAGRLLKRVNELEAALLAADDKRKSHGRRITELEQENATLRNTLARWRSLDGRKEDLGDRYDDQRVRDFRAKLKAQADHAWTPERKEAAVLLAKWVRANGDTHRAVDIVDPPPPLPEIAPCPRCGLLCELFVGHHGRYVGCNTDGCSWVGPFAPTDRAAIDAHNREAAALKGVGRG